MRIARQAIILALIVLSALPAASAVQPVATVLTTIGSNTVRKHGVTASTLLVIRGALSPGDVVSTGVKGKATILFSDGSQVRLNQNSRIELTPPVSAGKGKRSLFRVVWGEVWVRLRPGNAVQTRSAIAGARGTEFQLAVDQDETAILTVTEGSVDFFNEYGAVLVQESQQSVARLGSAPTTPVTVGNAGFIVEWTLDLERAAIPRESPGATAGKADLDARLAQARARWSANPYDAAAHLDYGNALFDSGRFDESLVEFNESDRLLPGQAATLARIGDALLELGRLDESGDTVSKALSVSPGYGAALLSRAYLELRHNNPGNAEESARSAAAAEPGSAQAQIALGLSLLRQPGKSEEARQAFEAALTGSPSEYRYQAHAYLALYWLDKNDKVQAIREAEIAKQMNGNSAVARGNLAMVYLFADRGRDAVREANAAVALNPSCVAALVVLAQSLLAEGRVDSAARTAAQAVALDPGLSQAQYVLGVADAQRRDYTHAERSLKRSLEATPDFLPAVGTLARVYLRMGRRADAISLLEDLKARYPDSHEILSAFGEIEYEGRRYPEAIQYYGSAIERSPDTARYYAELARVAIDANRLSDAIHAAQKAVSLAPENSQFQAILGLACEYGGLESQAESAYRTALALDGENALALVKLGFRNQEGDPRTAGRTAGLIFAQGFMYDPAISDELMRGGVKLEATAGGQEDGGVGELALRNHGDAGRSHLYGRAVQASDEAGRPNADDAGYFARAEMTLVPSAQSNAYAHVFVQDDDRGLPGLASDSALDDRRRFQFGEYILGYRWRFGDRSHLWAGVFGNNQKERLRNPDMDASLTLPGISIFGIPITMTDSKIDSDCRDVELRLDMDLGSRRDQPSVLTLGAALPTTNATYKSSLLLESAHYPDPISDPDNTGVLTDRRAFKTSLAYLQWTRRTGDKLWFATQVRSQRVRTTTHRSLLELTGTTLSALGDLTTSPPPEDKTRILPSIAAIYTPNRRTLWRLCANRRMTDVTSSIFVPTETLLITEGQVFPVGLPDITDTIELDYQRYLSAGETVKLYLFSSTARDVWYEFGDFSGSLMLSLGRVRRSGLGMRYERQLGGYLYGQIGLVSSSSKSESPDTSWDKREAPYNPDFGASIRLNYVDPRGTKLGLDVGYTGPFYQDTVDTLPGERPTFPATARVDLYLARERTVNNEYFLRIGNIFNARQIVFNDIPFGERTFLLGWTHRE